MNKTRSDRTYKRIGRIRHPDETILILCDEESVDYFAFFQSHFRLLSVTVDGFEEGGQDPVKVIEQAKERRKRQQFDTIWCVFNCDSREPRFKKAMELHQKYNRFIRLACSNPCFELWYLLHFEEQMAFIKDRESVIQKLDPHFHCNGMNRDNFPLLMDRLDTALTNADNLRRVNLEEWRNEFKNPSTHMDRLIRSLMPDG